MPIEANDVKRLPPKVILVPPPLGSAVPRKHINNIIGASIMGGIAGIALMAAQGWGILQWTATLIPLGATIVVVVAVSTRRKNKQLDAQRQAFRERCPSDRLEPSAAALVKPWEDPNRAPKIEDVKVALAGTLGEGDVDRAIIVCYGEAAVPDVGELHFEPEIITPTGAVRRQLVWLAIAGALIAWCVFDYANILPSWLPGARALMGGLMYFFAAGAIALSVWVWRGMIRPTYIRLAPGVIQVLVYSLSNRQPTVRSYPMETGTLAILTRIRKHLILTLARGETADTLLFSRMDRPQQRIDQTWRALLSTAPTPPLSNEMLVG